MNSDWPEESWERLGSQLELDLADLQLILRATLGRDDIVHSNMLLGGKCNTNYRVILSNQVSVVVRIYERDFAASKRDELISTMAAGHVPCPKMLGAVHDSGTLPEAFAARLGGRPVGIFEWVEGVKPFELFLYPSLIPEIATVLGETLARIGPLKKFEAHGLLDANLGFKRRFASNRISFEDFIQWSIEEGRAGERLGKELAARVSRFATENSELLDSTETNYGLVHGDYKLSNILMRPTHPGWEVAAVLDWEFAFAGTPLADASILLRHSDAWPGFEAAFAHGFVEAGGELPADWRAITRLLDLMNLCGFLNGSQHRENTYLAVRELIAHTVR